MPTPYEDFCAIVHDCSAEPYQSADEESMKVRSMAHQSVLEQVKTRFGTVIPFGFDTILPTGNGLIPPDQAVRDWLKGDYERLQSVLQKIKDRDEYGVQFFYEPGLICQQISVQSPEVVVLTERIEREMSAGAPGIAGIYRHRMKWALKEEMEKLADRWCQDFYRRVRHYCDDIMLEKTKKAEGDRIMLLNTACLVPRDKVNNLVRSWKKSIRRRASWCVSPVPARLTAL